ncbi:hypothetical protein [Staphylococcus carnosus]|uniref:Uncharacterized protein n=1 Tax=Staphylococcus carnosus (strain TM300) TaxID=396513 RepID=B9DKU3_STACT|nr:hypothetical protein [Staphylococcus carnosus]QPT03319.1 hypothetical protein I6G40_09535 [Staphylococcus carnosus]UQA68323.1 hypothetical protein Sta3580_05565 [Staphylococcus carnosus]CAL27131.1 hypothetical protein SCA_0218 [Staphylococcus carnosus subsp. carnosus TM300]SUL91457.1 Uncharacterised protein [Staphylococcus carnosus]GEP75734.1 hypothetical protein SCA04_00480 [Staphylococcus carnosus]
MADQRTIVDGRYAEYQGEIFRVINEFSPKLKLVTENPKAEAWGFKAQTTKHTNHTLYYKEVKRTEVDALYEIKHEARYGGTLFDLYYDAQGQSYIGTSEADKAEAFGLKETDEDYYSKPVEDDEYEPVIYRNDLE